MEFSDEGRHLRKRASALSKRHSVTVRLVYDGTNIRVIKREYGPNRALYVIQGFQNEVHMTESELKTLGKVINKYFARDEEVKL